MVNLLDTLINKYGLFKIIMAFLIFLIVIFLLVIWRLEYLMNLFDNMCFFEYTSDYICSCHSNKQHTAINLSQSLNLSILP